jgi:ribose transport system permease protein
VLSGPVVLALAALALVVGLGAVFNTEGSFFSAYTHASTLGQAAAFLVMACGMTVVVLTGGIDLSVGSVAALCGVVAAELAVRRGWPAWAAMGSGVGIGAACGVVSGVMAAYLRLQPFIATLAMMAFARGVAKWMSDNAKVVMLELPRGWEWIDRRIPVAGGFELPVVVLVAAACVVGTWVLLRLLPVGVWVYATGDNETAARYAGAPVRGAKVLAYLLSGALAGAAGIVVAAREHQGNPDGGMGYELTVIAMVVVGGTPLSGGRGGVMLTVLGALTIGYLQKVLDLNSFSPEAQLMITGVIIALAVLAQGWRRG